MFGMNLSFISIMRPEGTRFRPSQSFYPPCIPTERNRRMFTRK